MACNPYASGSYDNATLTDESAELSAFLRLYHTFRRDVAVLGRRLPCLGSPLGEGLLRFLDGLDDLLHDEIEGWQSLLEDALEGAE